MASLNITRMGWIAYAVAAGTLVLDQISKLYVLHILNLEPRGTILLPGPFDLTMVWNKGMSFGLLNSHGQFGRWLLTTFSVVVVVGLSIWARKATKPLMAAGIGMIIGGAIGNNLIDRIVYGAVADFIDVRDLFPWFPWIFNVADSGISVGVALLLLDSFLSEEKKLGRHETE